MFIISIGVISIGVFLGYAIGRFIVGLFFNMYEEPGNIIGNITGFTCMFVIFAILYARFFIITDKKKDLFIKQTHNIEEVKKYHVTFMKTIAKKEIILFTLYTLPMMIINYIYIIDYTNITDELYLSFSGFIYVVYSPLALFYWATTGIPFVGPVIGYLFSILFFTAGYAICLKVIFRNWAKIWYIDKKDLIKSNFTTY
jgi:hypothetical protein